MNINGASDVSCNGNESTRSINTLQITEPNSAKQHDNKNFATAQSNGSSLLKIPLLHSPFVTFLRHRRSFRQFLPLQLKNHTFPEIVGIRAKTSFQRARLSRHVLCSILSALNAGYLSII